MNSRHSFTLVELLLVLLLLGILAGLALPQFGPTYSRIQLKETADNIADLMRYAQSKAIIKRKIFGLQFDGPKNHYWIVEVKKDFGESSAPESYERVSGRFGRMRDVPERISVETEEELIHFYPDGTIDRISINLSNHRQERLTVSTLEKTGQVQVFDSSIN